MNGSDRESVHEKGAETRRGVADGTIRETIRENESLNRIGTEKLFFKARR